MKKNLFIAITAILMLANCNQTKTFAPLNGEWTIISIDTMTVPETADAFLGFNIAEQLIYGNTGCNHLTGSMPTQINPETPIFGAIGSTRRTCADMTVEDALLPSLAQVVDFKVNGDSLSLLDANGNIIISLVKR